MSVGRSIPLLAWLEFFEFFKFFVKDEGESSLEDGTVDGAKDVNGADGADGADRFGDDDTDSKDSIEKVGERPLV